MKRNWNPLHSRRKRKNTNEAHCEVSGKERSTTAVGMRPDSLSLSAPLARRSAQEGSILFERVKSCCKDWVHCAQGKSAVRFFAVLWCWLPIWCVCVHLGVRVCMCRHTHVYVFRCSCVCVCLCTRLCVYLCVCIYVCMCACTCTCVCMPVSVHLGVRVHVWRPEDDIRCLPQPFFIFIFELSSLTNEADLLTSSSRNPVSTSPKDGLCAHCVQLFYMNTGIWAQGLTLT